jgi:hypothetical protein
MRPGDGFRADPTHSSQAEVHRLSLAGASL